MDEQQAHLWYEQYRREIYRYLLTMSRDPCLAEDVLQDTFVRLLTDRPSLAPGKERAWLYKVARNRCFDLLRQRRRQADGALPDTAAPEERWTFLELISPLTEREQEVVSLRLIGSLSHREIAKVTGTTAAAARKRYGRAIQKLRQEMEESQ